MAGEIFRGGTVALGLLCGSITRAGWTAVRDELLAMAEDDQTRDRMRKELDGILEYTERIMGPRGENEFYHFLSRNRKPD